VFADYLDENDIERERAEVIRLYEAIRLDSEGPTASADRKLLGTLLSQNRAEWSFVRCPVCERARATQRLADDMHLECAECNGYGNAIARPDVGIQLWYCGFPSSISCRYSHILDVDERNVWRVSEWAKLIARNFPIEKWSVAGHGPLLSFETPVAQYVRGLAAADVGRLGFLPPPIWDELALATHRDRDDVKVADSPFGAIAECQFAAARVIRRAAFE